MLSFQEVLRIIRGGYEEEDDTASINLDDGDGLGMMNSRDQSLATGPQPWPDDLLMSGDFGRIGVKHRTRQFNPNIVKTILRQRSCAIPVHNKEDIHCNLVPNTIGTTVANYDARIYTAFFSKDSSFFYTCSQVRKVIQGSQGNWTITDADLSPNNEQIIYSSISPTVYMTSTSPDGGNPTQIPIFLGDTRRTTMGLFEYYDVDGSWSCRFSADGKEVIGGSGRLFVYDLPTNRRTVKINAQAIGC